MTIYDIKRESEEKSPYFFNPDTLRFFGQTLEDFEVSKQPDGRFKISAPIIDHQNTNMGETIRYYNPVNNELERK